MLLVGLLLNSLFGWSWADPLAALVIAVIAITEGINAWKGEICCATTSIEVDPCGCCDNDIRGTT